MSGLGRSLLFAPGDRPERFAKARAAGADIVCIDLEDGVAPASRPAARANALLEIARSDDQSSGCPVCLRINSVRTADGLRDLLAVEQMAGTVPTLVIPKVEGPDELRIMDAVLARPGQTPIRFVPMIETAVGLENVSAILNALPRERLAGVIFGAVDLAVDLQCALAWEPLLFARSRVVQAARVAGIGVMDAPYLDVNDAAGLEAEVRRLVQLGMAGKAAIHPRQIEPIHRAFAPAEAEVTEAAAIVEAYERMGGGVALLNGRLIERPVYAAARNVLVRAGRS